jgi:protein ERP2
MVRGKLTRAQEFQDQIRAFEARDRNTAEGNFTRVNFWSMIHLIALLITGVVQVVMVRSLFDEKSTLRRLWKQGKM